MSPEFTEWERKRRDLEYQAEEALKALMAHMGTAEMSFEVKAPNGARVWVTSREVAYHGG